MAQEIKQGNIFGRIGSGIGQGLAEQLPKEIERNRLASGLKNLGENAHNMTPFQQLAQFYSTPGVTSQMIQSGTPLLQQQSIRQAGPVATETGPRVYNPQQKQFNRSVYDETIDGPIGRKQKGSKNPYEDRFVSLTNVEDVQNTHYPIKTEDQVEKEAFHLWNENPQRFPGGLSEARQKIEAGELRDQKVFDSLKQKRIADIDKSTQTVNKLNEKINGDIPAEIRQEVEQNALKKVLSGKMTPEKAGLEAAAEANDFIKERDILKNLGATPLTRAPESTVKELKRVRDSYEKYNALPIFVSDMKNYNGLGDHLASSIAYPLSESLQKSIPDREFANKKNVNEDDLAQNLSKNFSMDDSFFSLGLALEENGWDSDKVMNKFIDLVDQNKLPLTSVQKNELTSYSPLNYTLGDIFLSHFTDLFSNKKIPTSEKIRRTWYKKR